MSIERETAATREAAPLSPSVLRRVATAFSATAKSAISSARVLPRVRTIEVWEKWRSAKAASALCAAMMRGTTPSVTRLCAFSRPCTLRTSTAMIAAVSARITPKQSPSLMDRRTLPSRGMRRGDGDTHSL